MKLLNHENDRVETKLVFGWKSERRGITANGFELREDAAGELYLLYRWTDDAIGPAVAAQIHLGALPEDNVEVLIRCLAGVVKTNQKLRAAIEAMCEHATHASTCGKVRADHAYNKGYRGTPGEAEDCTCVVATWRAALSE